MTQHAITYFVLTHTLDPGVGSKDKNIFLQKVVMLHIKLNDMEHRAPCMYKFCPYTHPQPPVGVKMSKHSVLKVVMLHIKLKGMEHGTWNTMQAHSLSLHTPSVPGWGQKIGPFFLKAVVLRIKDK